VPASLRCGATERSFTLLMPNMPRLVDAVGKRYCQQPGECVLTDSEEALVGVYAHPHAAICLNIPVDTVRGWLPEGEDFGGLRLGNSSSSSRIISLLLLSVWQAIESGDDELVSRGAADALLGLLARRCRRAVRGNCRGDAKRTICCELVKDFIDNHLRDPRLSVQMVAERIGVTTRYLQLLFAGEGECVSEYIKRERLTGCLLDLRDAGFDRQSITEIAFAWGFNSAAHFSSSFRKEYGLCPRDYRNCGADELAGSRLAEADGALVRALLVLNRSVRNGHGAFASNPRDTRPAVAYG
jgi:AraC-like DNA-binding protein